MFDTLMVFLFVLFGSKTEAMTRGIKLELHPTKTEIVYCQDKNRKKEYPNTEFDFLRYTFRRIFIKDRLGRVQFNFLPSVNKKSAKAFKDKIQVSRLHSFTGSKIEMIAEKINRIIRGWLNYFTEYNPSAIKYTIKKRAQHIFTLDSWNKWLNEIHTGPEKCYSNNRASYSI